jgi:hypothetical protein
VNSSPTIGTRIHYTGDRANPHGHGYIVSERGDVALDDGRYFHGSIVHFDSGPGCRFFVVDGKESADQVECVRRIEAETKRVALRIASHKQAEEHRSAMIATGSYVAAALLKDAPAVIIARHREDQSDAQTDYFASRTTRTVVLAASKHTRSLFPEMRKAAARFLDTAGLETGGVEHRETYSMGAGIYLSQGEFRHDTGWEIRKTTRGIAWGSDVLIALAKGDHHL